MNVDPQELAELLEQSQDLQADAINGSKEPLSHLVEAHHTQESGLESESEAANRDFADQHRRTIQHKLATTGLLGVAGGGLLVALLASPAFASEPADVQILQTACSIENLAISTYATALTLPYIGGSSANPVVKKFCQVTKSQHMQHDAAFTSALLKLHGKKQTKPDPAFVPVVKKAVDGLAGASATQGALGVVALALELENIAAETYVNDMAQLKNTNAKRITASIMGVEAQHASVLLAVQALLQAGAPQLITLSTTNVASLPAAAGSVGFPNAFYPTKDAAPKTQGAVK